MEHLFSRVDNLLSRRGISQRQMCLTVGISPQSYSNYKSSGSLPPVETVCKIADFLNTTVEYLVNGKLPTDTQDKLSRIKAVLCPDISAPVYSVDIFETIKSLCSSNKISQKDLSEKLGWDSRYIENKIYHKTAFSVEEVIAICNYFHVSIYSLIDNSEMTQDADFYKEQIKTIIEIINS